MIRKLFLIQKPKFRFFFSTEEQPDLLDKVMRLMNMKSPLLNEEIDQPQVQLIDQNEVFLGIKNIKDALQIAHKSQMDLVLNNDKVFPVICKIQDFENHIYQKFLKEYMKKYGIKNDIKHFNKSLQFEIKPFILQQDLQMKIQNIMQSSKTSKKIQVKVFFNENCEEDAKDKLLNIADQLRAQLVSTSEMYKQEIQILKDKWKITEDDELYSHFICQDFQQKQEFDKSSKETPLDKNEIKRLLNKFFYEQQQNKMLSNIEQIQENEQQQISEPNQEEAELKQIFQKDEYREEFEIFFRQNLLRTDDENMDGLFAISKKYKVNLAEIQYEFKQRQYYMKKRLMARLDKLI